MTHKDIVAKTSFTDWMNKGFIGKYCGNHPEMSIQLAKPLVLANGVILSVQASKYHYCHPRQNAPVADYAYYDTFELGYPSQQLPEEFTKYAADADYLLDTVYAYVPKELLQNYIDAVGGVVGFQESEQPIDNGVLPSCTNLSIDLKTSSKNLTTST